MYAALEQVGNPSSVHAEGRAARKFVEDARRSVAALVGAVPENVIFTSGGTEANASALSPFWRYASDPSGQRLTHLFISAVEHPCVLSGGSFATDEISHISVDLEGVVDLKKLKVQLEAYRGDKPDGRFLVSVMGANNETGAIQPLKEIAALVHEFDGLFHSDLVQLVGKERVHLCELEADLITLSAHKIGGPQGVGALVLGRGDVVNEKPLFVGGGQEKRRRGGTENIAAIAGFGAAADEAQADLDDWERLSGLQKKLEDGLRDLAQDCVVFSFGARRLPNTTCFAMRGFSAETSVINLDLAGIAVSAGSACSSGKVERSHVLEAMNVEDELNKAALRVSLGWASDGQDVDRFLESWRRIYERHKNNQAAA